MINNSHMLLADESTVANTVLWQETIAVAPATAYTFSGWISTFDRSGTFNQNPVDIHPADYKFVVNGTQIGTFALPTPTNDGTWGQFSADWQAGAATSAQIQIFLVRTDASANDAVVDDLSFVAIPEPGTMLLLGATLMPLLFRRRGRA